MKIFVSIVSYRDPLLYDTIMSLIDTKSGCAIVRIGIFEQTKFENSLEATHPELLDRADIVYKRIDPEHSDGVGWARHINSLQLEEADFFYQIDSHAVFDKNWDRSLIKDYELAVKKYNNNRIVVTSNCKNYHLDDDGRPVKECADEHVTCKSTFFAFPKTFKISAHGEWIPAQSDVTDAYHIFAGNLFTRADWVREVGINPKMYFHGEEQHLTLSTMMAGYNICHPREIKCYHFLGSNEHICKQWIKPVISDKKRRKLQADSDAEFYNFLMSIDDDFYEKFRKYSGVDYVNRKIEKRRISVDISAPAHIPNDWEIPDRND